MRFPSLPVLLPILLGLLTSNKGLADAAECPSDNGKSYEMITPFPQSDFVYEYSTVDNGSLCCGACSAKLNCVLAMFNHTSKLCSLMINKVDRTELEKSDLCPLGIFEGGTPVDSHGNWDHLILGGCFKAD